MQLLCNSVQAKKATLSRGWLSWRLWHGRRCGELGNASEPLEAKVRWQRTSRVAAGSDADVLVAQALDERKRSLFWRNMRALVLTN
jgi:hypothetical protein